MPLLDLKCDRCGYSAEELVKADGVYPKCPHCGEELKQDYNGALKVNSVKKSHCSGHCATCGGCK